VHYLGILSGGWLSLPTDINDAGMMVGFSIMSAGGSHSFLWNGEMHDLGEEWAVAINDAGQVVGNPGPLLWDDGVMYDLGAVTGTAGSVNGQFSPNPINSAGHVVGTSVSGRATLWRRMTPVEHLEICTGQVVDLERLGVLNAGQTSSLVNKVNVATAMLNDAKATPAVNALEAFQNEASGYVNGGILTSEQGEELAACVQVVINEVFGSQAVATLEW
jgi:probable HAF family extracellular repeat protein